MSHPLWDAGRRHSFHGIGQTFWTIGMRKKAVRQYHPVHFPKHLFGDPTLPITGTSLLITNASAETTDRQEQFLLLGGGRVQSNPIQAQFMCADDIWTLIEFQWDHLSESMPLTSRIVS